MIRFLTLVAALALTSQVHAIQISAGDSWTVNWSKQATPRNGLANDLTVTSKWLVSSYTANSIILDISLTNSSSLTGNLTKADVTAFGFLTSNLATSSLLSPGTMFNRNVSGGWLHVLHGSGSGLQAGATDRMQLQLTGRFGRYVDLLMYPMKISTNHNHYLLAGQTPAAGSCQRNIIRNCNPAPVPEPSIAVLLLIGLATITVMRQLVFRQSTLRSDSITQ